MDFLISQVLSLHRMKTKTGKDFTTPSIHPIQQLPAMNIQTRDIAAAYFFVIIIELLPA
jgi:hypothetical protein